MCSPWAINSFRGQFGLPKSVLLLFFSGSFSSGEMGWVGWRGKKENSFTWAARAAQMRNMHRREAMKTWTSDSAAKHIPVLKEKAPRKKKCLSKVTGIMPVWETVIQGLIQTVNNAFPKKLNAISTFSFFSSLAPLLGWMKAYWHIFLRLGSLLLQFSKPSINCGRVPLAWLCGISTLPQF